MNINIKRLILSAAAAFLLAGCADWVSPEKVEIGNTDLVSPDKDNAYYQALREYKASKHEISFGWYSRWDEPALTTDGMLMGIPDSMDVVSLWSNSRNLSPGKKEDLRFVQEVKGTKVLLCTFCQYIGKNFTPAEFDSSPEDPAKREEFWGWVDGDEAAIASAIAKYAKAISDTVSFYGYDGLDVDFEPNIDGVPGKLDENPEYATLLFNELSKYFGPKSGTGRLFVIDGEIYNLNPDLCTCFDYFVSQAYTVSGGTPPPDATGYESNMESRLGQLVERFSGKMSEEEITNKFVVTENLESALDALNGGFFWRTKDGVTQAKERVPSMLGMAMWQPDNGFRKGGFGGYRFDNESINDPSYKWMRRGIQFQNPAGGVRKILVRFSDNASNSFEYKKDYFGNFPVDKLEVEFGLMFAGIPPQSTDFKLTYEPSYALQYSNVVGAAYQAVEQSRVSISNDGLLNVAPATVRTDKMKVTVDLKELSVGDYVIPVKINLPENSPYYSDEELVRYITLSWKEFEPIKVRLSAAENLIPVKLSDDGSLPSETVVGEFNVNLAENAPETVSFFLAYDPSLVESYNAANNLAFASLDASKISVSPSVEMAAGTSVSENAAINVSLDGIASGKYLIPVRVSLPDGAPLTSDGELVHYLKLQVGRNIVKSADSVSGRKIEPTDSWEFNCYNGYATDGWSGVWYLETEQDRKAMMDGYTYSDESPYYWMSTSGYFNPGNVIVGMDKVYSLIGFRWHVAYGQGLDVFDFIDVQISNDRNNWDTISYNTRITPAISSDGWINLQFSEPVEAKYFRLIVGTSYYVSMDECELWTPAN